MGQFRKAAIYASSTGYSRRRSRALPADFVGTRNQPLLELPLAACGRAPAGSASAGRFAEEPGMESGAAEKPSQNGLGQIIAVGIEVHRHRGPGSAGS